MGTRTLRAFSVSIVRALLAIAFAWFVRKGLVDHSLAQEAAGVLAFLVVDRIWEFYLLHRADLFQRWLLLIGLQSPSSTPPGTIADLARTRAVARLEPGMKL
jgi:predicted membrane protein